MQPVSGCAGIWPVHLSGKMELSKTKFGVYASLSSAKMRRRHALFTIEGEKSVADTIDHFEVEAVLYTDRYEGSRHYDPSKTFHVGEEAMKKLSNLATPSCIMAVYRIPEREAALPAGISDGLYVVLDGVQDPGNLGTIVRTCHWFGIRHIFASNDTVDIYNPKTVMSTMGSIAKVKVTYCDLDSLFMANPVMPVYGMSLAGDDIFRTRLEKRGFIVMGNEGKGISEKVRRYVSHPLFIPPGNEDHSESLNVAIATGITVAQFVGR